MTPERRHLRSRPGQPGLVREGFLAAKRLTFPKSGSKTPTSVHSAETADSRAAVEPQPQPQPQYEHEHEHEHSPPLTAGETHVALDDVAAKPEEPTKASNDNKCDGLDESRIPSAGDSATMSQPLSTKAASGPAPSRGGCPRDSQKEQTTEPPSSEENLDSIPAGGELLASGEHHLPQDKDPRATLWRRAWMELPEPDRKDLSTKEDLIQVLSLLKVDATEAHDKCIQNKWTFTWKQDKIILSDVANRVIGWIDKFKTIGDVVTSFDPMHAALPWAAIRILLQVAVQDNQQMGAILIGLERVSPLIQRCTVIEILYITKNPAAGQAAKNLENSLLALYTALLNYLIAAKRLCTESSARRVLKSVFDPEALTPLLDAITTTENRVNSDSSLAEAEYNKFAHSRNIDAMRQTLANALHDLSMPLHRIDVTLSGISAVLDETERAEILAWISPISYEKHHRQACERRTPNTGEWILARKEFMQWINSSSTTLLWLRGIPGAGKTMLTSRVIEDMMTRRDEENISALAYFYCDKKEQIRGKPEEILRALVKQLSHIPSQGGHVFQSVVTKYKHRKDAGNHKPGEDPLSLKECCELLAGLTNLYPLTVLVIDALDEAEEDSRYQLFQALKDLVVSSEKLVKIFVSSRDNHDIVLQLEKFSNFHIEARDNREDIEKFVRVESRALIDRKGWGPDVEEALCSALTAQANGMFMWASLHMKFLNTLRGRQAVFDRLKQLPPDLEATYEEILNRINKQETTDRTVAMRALQWVLVAREPLHPRQLCAAIHANIAHDSGQVNNEDKPTIELILGSCENLLVHDIELDVIRFAHLSVAEYLDSYLNFIEAHALAAIACLQYFFADSSTLKELSSYAAEYAFIHAKLCQEGSHREKPFPRLREMLQTFFHPVQSKQFDFWLSNISLPKDRMYRVFYWSDHIFPPITWVVFFGLKTTFKEVYPLDIVPGHLHLAACEGHLEIVNILLERGADVNLVGGDYGTALGIAAWYGYKEIVNILLERGADVNLVGGHYGTPLEIAAQCGYKEIVNTFLERGADVNLAGGRYGTPLGRAAWYGHQEIVNVLLERGADVNLVGGGYGTALGAAAWIGNREIVNVLLERGADVNLIGGDCGTALGAAAWIGNLEIVNILLERGADVNLIGGDYGTALGAAAWSTDQKIVNILLEHGADVNLVGGEYGTALAAAAWSGRQGICNILLERGADVNLVGGRYGTALGAAASRGNREIVNILLERGADINLVGGDYGTALGAAAFPVTYDLWGAEFTSHEKFESSREKLAVVRILIKRGADVNLPAGKYGTVLGIAAYSGEQELIKLLLDHGADANLVGDEFQAALQLVAQTSEETVSTDLDNASGTASIDHDASSPSTNTTLS